jgi:hypothetical protein
MGVRKMLEVFANLLLSAAFAGPIAALSFTRS